MWIAADLQQKATDFLQFITANNYIFTNSDRLRVIASFTPFSCKLIAHQVRLSFFAIMMHQVPLKTATESEWSQTWSRSLKQML